MENRHKAHIEELELNVNRLLTTLEQLQKENGELKALLHQRTEDMKQAHREIMDLRDEKQAMESAQGLSVFGNQDATKKHLNSLVREIDKCLVLLKV